MVSRCKYVRRAGNDIVAIRLDLETEGFRYNKWGGQQICKRGDWLVSNGGDTYTVDHDVFLGTYRLVSPGCYRKIAPVWAEVAESDGEIPTKEGKTRFAAGDYLVYNDEAGTDGWAVPRAKFETMYELVIDRRIDGRGRSGEDCS